MNEKKKPQEKIQWHQGFFGGIQLDLRAYKESLTFEKEYELSQKALKMDMLILKKSDGVEIGTGYGRIFRRHNVIEYKSPEDELNIDTFYKSLGYAFLYKGLGERVNEVPAEQLTVSVFRHSKPRELFRALSDGGRGLENPYPGVYYVSGFGLPTQIVVTREISADEGSVLRLLTHGADIDATRRFLQRLDALSNPGDRENARSVLEVVSEANLELLVQLRRESGMMDEVLRIVYGDEYDIALQRAQSDGIAQGMERGIAQGMERGIAQGMERGRKETRKEYENILTQKDRELEMAARELHELEAAAQELRELKLRYGLL